MSNAVLTVGTLSAEIADELKAKLLNEAQNRVSILCFDTHFPNPNLQNLGANEIVGFGDVAVNEIAQTPSRFASAKGIFTDLLQNHPKDLAKGGALVPTATLLAARASHDKLSLSLRGLLDRMLDLEHSNEPLSFWIIGSVASTTGRGVLHEIMIQLNLLLAEYPGLNTSISKVVIDCQGLKPENHAKRELLSAAYWLEDNAIMEGHVIDRPHDQENPSWQGSPSDYTFHLSAQSEGWKMNSIEQLKQYAVEWVYHTVIKKEIEATLSATRVRHLPQIGGTDGREVDAKRTYLSISGFAVETMRLPEIRSYAKYRLIDEVCSVILGEPPADTGSLIISLDLHLSTLEERLGLSSFSTVISQEQSRMSQKLENTSIKKWRDIVTSSLVNVEKQIKNANDLTPKKRDEILKDIQNRLVKELIYQTNGVKHILKSLEDVSKHINTLHDQVVAQMRTLKKIDETRKEIEEILKGINSLSRIRAGAIREKLKKALRGGEDAIKIVLCNNIIGLLNDLQQFITYYIKTAREIVDRVEVAQTMVDQKAERALQTLEAPTVRYLIDSTKELEKFITGVVNRNNAEVVRDAVVKRVGEDDGHLLDLIEYRDAEHLMDITEAVIDANKYLGTITGECFETLFLKKYPTKRSQNDFWNWLLSHSTPVGGAVDRTYEQRIGAVAPQKQMRIFVPSSMVDTAEEALTSLLPNVDDGTVVGVDNLSFILATRELHGIPLYSMKYFRDLVRKLPKTKDQLAKYFVAEWALRVNTYLPYEPFDNWSHRDIILLGSIVKAIENGDGKQLAYRKGQVTYPLGRDYYEAEAKLQEDSYRPEIIQQIQDKLQAISWKEFEAMIDPSVQSLPEFSTDILAIHRKLETEFERIKNGAGLL